MPELSYEFLSISGTYLHDYFLSVSLFFVGVTHFGI